MPQKPKSTFIPVCVAPLDKYMIFTISFVSLSFLNTKFGYSNHEGWLERHYTNYYNFFEGQHFWLFIVGNVVVMFVTYWALGAIYMSIDLMNTGFITRFKIQPEINSTIPNPSTFKCIRQVLLNQFVVIPFMVIMYAVLAKFGDMTYEPEQLPTSFTLFWDVIINSVFLEISFYYSHRIIHHPMLYKHVHKMHHEWLSPTAISFFYTHPIEHVVGILIPFEIGQFFRPIHHASSLLWVVISISIGMHEHSGYHFPMMDSTEFHSFHHTRFNQNYGLVGLMDWIHGTDKEFRKSAAYERHICFFGSTPIQDIVLDHSQERNPQT